MKIVFAGNKLAQSSICSSRTFLNARPLLSSTPFTQSTTTPSTFTVTQIDDSCAQKSFYYSEMSFNGKTSKKLNFQQQRMYGTETTKIPDFSTYKKDVSSDPSKGRAFTYVMYGTTGFVSALGAKSFLVDFLTQLTPSEEVLALAKAEVDLTHIPEGKNVTIKWRGKPVFIRHRTLAEIDEANSVSLSVLRDPQSDADRVKKAEWLVVLGICTHLGCVPIGESGDYDGWYCPCHGSHYDISGRIRKGPAPLNLEVPPYEFNEDDTKLIIG